MSAFLRRFRHSPFAWGPLASQATSVQLQLDVPDCVIQASIAGSSNSLC